MWTRVLRVAACLGALATGLSAAEVQLPGGTLTVPGDGTTTPSFIFPGPLTQNDTIAFGQSDNPCLQLGGYCTNGAGVTVAGATPVGEASVATIGAAMPPGTWAYGSLLMVISGVGAVQVFPTNAVNGLGSPTPPAALELPPTTLAGLGFGTFAVSNPTITFLFADTGFDDNSGRFVLTQTVPSSVTLPGGILIVPADSTTGVSFAFSGTLTQNDTISFAQTENPCGQIGGYCTNAAGVLTVAATAGGTPVGGSYSFVGGLPVGTWTFGSLLMSISGVGAVQVFPTNADNGLGSPTPPASLTLPQTTLAGLGFGNFAVSNPRITFFVADTHFGDNSGQFVLSQGPQPPTVTVPMLGSWGFLSAVILLAGTGVIVLRRFAG